MAARAAAPRAVAPAPPAPVLGAGAPAPATPAAAGGGRGGGAAAGAPAPPSPAAAARRGGTALRAAMAAVAEGGSSDAALKAYLASTEGMTAKQKQAYLLKRRADEARLQQLRGVFAAADEDRDGVLAGGELPAALLALGFDPSPRTLQRYFLASPTGQVDLATVSGGAPGVRCFAGGPDWGGAKAGCPGGSISDLPSPPRPPRSSCACA
jgi:hypothetical protein